MCTKIHILGSKYFTWEHTWLINIEYVKMRHLGKTLLQVPGTLRKLESWASKGQSTWHWEAEHGGPRGSQVCPHCDLRLLSSGSAWVNSCCLCHCQE